MSNTRTPEFTKDEIRLITATLKKGCGHDIEAQQTDAEIKPGLCK